MQWSTLPINGSKDEHRATGNTFGSTRGGQCRSVTRAARREQPRSSISSNSTRIDAPSRRSNDFIIRVLPPLIAFPVSIKRRFGAGPGQRRTKPAGRQVDIQELSERSQFVG